MGITETVKISMRTYFSSYHLWAANHLAVLAKEIEDKHSGKPIFNIKHRAYVTNSILSSVAFLEAAVNEIFQDAADGHHHNISHLPEKEINILADYWKMTEIKNKSHISTLDKYQLAIRFCGKEPFDLGKNPYQDAQNVIRLRNTIVHYKPESISKDDPHALSKRLNKKFITNALMKNSGNPFYPDHCLGYGCAKWACEAMENIADDFFKSIEVLPNYKQADFGNSNG